MLEFVILVLLLGLIPAVIAHRKGESFVVWWIYGAALFIVALPHALLGKPNPGAIEQQQLAEHTAGFQRTFEENGGRIVQKLWPPITTPD